jgi:hypothetical protein
VTSPRPLVPASDLRSAGPCLVCDEPTEYSLDVRYNMYRRYGNNWLDRQFKPRKRAEHINAMEEGHGFHESLWDGFVCRECKEALEQDWPRREVERKERGEQERQERSKLAEAERFRTTWRMPDADEFPITDGRCEFLVRSFTKPDALLTFRWRTCLARQCRGNNPAQRVGLWVKNRLCAHYYAWDLGVGESDLFSWGILSWVEKTFQRELRKIEPEAIWRARPPIDQRNGEWNGLHAIHICDFGPRKEYPAPCVIQTVWPNGAAYAHLRNFRTTREIIDFVRKSIGVYIQVVMATAPETFLRRSLVEFASSLRGTQPEVATIDPGRTRSRPDSRW